MISVFLFVMSRHDISDEKSAVIGPMPEKENIETRGREHKNDRHYAQWGILWILKMEAPWRDLPAEFRPWDILSMSVYSNG